MPNEYVLITRIVNTSAAATRFMSRIEIVRKLRDGAVRDL